MAHTWTRIVIGSTLLSTLAGGASGCDKADDAKPEKQASQKKNAKGDGAAPADDGDAPADADAGADAKADSDAEAPEPELAPITPALYDGRALRASEFAAAFTAWEGKSVVFAGNPVFFFDEDALTGSVEFNTDPTSRDDKPVRCEMKADDPETFNKTKVAVVKGTYKDLWGPEHQIRLEGCEKVELRDDMPPEIEGLSPETYDGTTAIPLPQLVGAFAWKDKEITIIGAFNGSTTSTMPDGTKYIRIDIGDDAYSPLVSCHLEEAVPQENVGTDKVWKFKGKATGELAFGRPDLTDCEFVEQVEP